jgi:uncharacterized hydrophobic protein (TIGR00271 family)
MRLLQVLVARDDLDAVLDALRAEDVDPVVLSVSDDSAVRVPRTDGATVGRDDSADHPSHHLVQFPVPTEAVGSVRETLTDCGVDEEYLVIANAETATTPQYGTLLERFVEGTEESEHVSNEEIRAKARSLDPRAPTYYAMTVLSAFVATAGLLLDSPALVVGSMVVAPQIGAALTASVGGALGDDSMFVAGLKTTLTGLVVAILAAAMLGWGLKTAQFVPPALDVTTVQQIASRTSPGLLTLVVALCAGSAGAFGLATELPVSLVGVAVAAAVVPAAAAVGIGLAWALPAVTLGAFALLAVNVTGIVLSGTATLWYLEYRPDEWPDSERLRSKVRFVGTQKTTYVALGLLVLTVVGPGALLTQQIVFENQTTSAVQSVVEDPSYADIELTSVRVEFAGAGVSSDARDVTVSVRLPAGERIPTLAAELRRAIADETGEGVQVTVSVTEVRREGGPERQSSYGAHTRATPSSKDISGSHPVAAAIFETSAFVSWT